MLRRLAVATIVLLLSAATASFCFFYYRDNFSTHYPVKTISASTLRSGEIPMWNFHAGGGQPLAANPNFLTFYPTTLFYLVAPPMIAFNLHFLLHLVAAFFALRALTMSLGCSPRAASLGGALYTISGVAVSLCGFYNLITALALVPATLLAAERLRAEPSFRRTLLLGAALGLVGLMGEPATIASVGLSLVFLSLPVFSLRFAAHALVALAIALVVVSPVLIAYSEVHAETERGGHRFSTASVLTASLRPIRLFEIFVGPFLGSTLEYTPAGYQIRRGDQPLFLNSVFIGPLLIPALFSRRVPARFRWLFVVLAVLALGRFNPLVLWIVERVDWLHLARYPEKLMIAATVAAFVLISIWLDRPTVSRRERIGIFAALFVMAAFAGFAFINGPPGPVRNRILVMTALAAITLVPLLGRQGRHPERSEGSPPPSTIVARLKGILRFAQDDKASEGRDVGVMLSILLSVGSLGYWAIRGLPLDWARYYRPSAPIANHRFYRIFDPEFFVVPFPHARARYRVSAQLDEPLFGMTRGLRYVADHSPDGMYSLLSRNVGERLDAAKLPLALRYLRLLSTQEVLSRFPYADPSLRLVGRGSVGPNQIYRYALLNTLPDVRVLTRMIPARSIQEAVRRIESPGFDERAVAIVPYSADPPPAGGAAIRRAHRRGQTMEIEIDAESPATIAISESYFSAWRATAGGEPLRILPVNIDRLGIVVPAGHSVITLRYGRRNAAVAATAAASLIVLAAAGLTLARMHNAKCKMQN